MSGAREPEGFGWTGLDWIESGRLGSDTITNIQYNKPSTTFTIAIISYLPLLQIFLPPSSFPSSPWSLFSSTSNSTPPSPYPIHLYVPHPYLSHPIATNPTQPFPAQIKIKPRPTSPLPFPPRDLPNQRSPTLHRTTPRGSRIKAFGRLGVLTNMYVL